MPVTALAKLGGLLAANPFPRRLPMRATRPRTPDCFSRRLSSLAWLAIPLGASLAGCGDKQADPAGLSAEAALRVQDIIHNGASGVGFEAGSDSTLQKIMSGIGTANDGLASGAA